MIPPCLLRYHFVMRFLPLVLALLLAACAERWEKPGTTEAESDAAQSACTAQAAEKIAPAMVWMQVQPAYWEPGDRHCWTGANGATYCRSSPPRWRPPVFDWVDVNIPARREARAQCLQEQGFSYQGLRPLRLF
ncbi:MAG: hypothetical protein RL312_166 [Pseudomonadota bacterium]|jgi:hypothetical protein